jgi:hypothetical protein
MDNNNSNYGSKFAVSVGGTVRFRPASSNSRTISGLMIHLNHYYKFDPVFVRFDGGTTSDDSCSSTDETYSKETPFSITGHGQRPEDFDDVIVVRAFTKQYGIQHIPSWLAEGWAYWSLNKLDKERHAHSNGVIALKKPVIMHVVAKGIHPESASVGDVLLTITRLQLNVSEFQIRQRVSRAVRVDYANAIANHMSYERQMESKLLIVKENANRIRMIDYKNDVAQRAGELPCFAFLFGPIPQSTPDYWQRIYDMIEKRGEMDLYRHLPAIYQQAILAVKLVSFHVHWLEYAPDIFKTTTGKSFDADYFADALVTLADDCDGLTKAILMAVISLKRLAAVVKMPGHLRRLVDILTMYVPIAMLCGTTAASAIATDSSSKSDEITGAHFALLLLPIDYFIECVGRAMPSHPLAQLVIGEEQLAASRQLPVLYGEGTGRIEPYGIPDPAPRERDRVFSAELEELSRTDIFYGREEHTHFIVWPVSGTTRAFIDGDFGGKRVNVGSFYFVSSNGGSKKLLCRGASYSSIISRGRNVGILPTDCYTDKEILYIQTECSLCPPVASLVPPTTTVLPKQHTGLDALCTHLKARNINGGGGKNRTVRIYVRQECVTPEFLQLLDNQLRDCQTACGMSYYPEYVMAKIEGYVLSIYFATE